MENRPGGQSFKLIFRTLILCCFALVAVGGAIWFSKKKTPSPAVGIQNSNNPGDAVSQSNVQDSFATLEKTEVTGSQEASMPTRNVAETSNEQLTGKIPRTRDQTSAEISAQEVQGERVDPEELLTPKQSPTSSDLTPSPEMTPVRPSTEFQQQVLPQTAPTANRCDPEFWLWAGVGENFQYYEQSVPSLSGSAKFQNIQGPTLYLSVGTQGKNFGAEFVHKETPGEMQAPAGSTVRDGKFIWKTLSSEVLYKVDESNWRLRLGLQYHMMPFMVYEASSATLNVKSNSLALATIGFDRIISISKKLRGEWQLRYQHPVMTGTNSSDSFSVTPIFAFDGSIGTVYSLKNDFRIGLFWYGQYHHYKFDYSGAATFSGEQSLFYSNAEVRLGLEF